MNEKINATLANLTVFKCKGQPSGDINDQSNRPDEYEMEFSQNLLQNTDAFLDPSAVTLVRGRAVGGDYVFDLEIGIFTPGLNNQQIRPFVNHILARLSDALKRHELAGISNSKQKEWFRNLSLPDIQIGATVLGIERVGHA